MYQCSFCTLTHGFLKTDKTLLINKVTGMPHPFPILLNDYKTQHLRRDTEDAYTPSQDRNT